MEGSVPTSFAVTKRNQPKQESELNSGGGRSVVSTIIHFTWRPPQQQLLGSWWYPLVR